MIETDLSKLEKVVVQFGVKTIKGYLQSPLWDTIEDVLSNAPRSAPESFRVRCLDSDRVEEIPTRDVKAVFYVNSFDGNPRHTRCIFILVRPSCMAFGCECSFSMARSWKASCITRCAILSIRDSFDAHRSVEQQQAGLCAQKLARRSPGAGDAQTLSLGHWFPQNRILENLDRDADQFVRGLLRANRPSVTSIMQQVESVISGGSSTTNSQSVAIRLLSS